MVFFKPSQQQCLGYSQISMNYILIPIYGVKQKNQNQNISHELLSVIWNPFFSLLLDLLKWHSPARTRWFWEATHAALYIPELNINYSAVTCCCVCLSAWEGPCSPCAPVAPYLKNAFLRGSQWVPFRRIQELEGENVMQKFAISCHSDPTQTQRRAFMRRRKPTHNWGRGGEQYFRSLMPFVAIKILKGKILNHTLQ